MIKIKLFPKIEYDSESYILEKFGMSQYKMTDKIRRSFPDKFELVDENGFDEEIVNKLKDLIASDLVPAKILDLGFNEDYFEQVLKNNKSVRESYLKHLVRISISTKFSDELSPVNRFVWKLTRKSTYWLKIDKFSEKGRILYKIER